MRYSEVPLSVPLRGASPLGALRRFGRNALWPKGRASRSEYWWVWLVITAIVSIANYVVPARLGALHNAKFTASPFGTGIGDLIQIGSTSGGGTSVIPWQLTFGVGAITLVTLIPMTTLMVRRLHDVGLSGAWLLLAFVPHASFVLIVMLAWSPRASGLRFDVDPEDDVDAYNFELKKRKREARELERARR